MSSLERPEPSVLNAKLVPGPCQYDPIYTSAIKASPAYGFGAKLPEPAKHVPGPGSYNLKPYIGNEGLKKSMAGSASMSLHMMETRSKPGPGAYDPKYSGVSYQNRRAYS